MKTSWTIEAQEERKKDEKDANGDGGTSRANTPPARQKLKRRDAT